MSTQEETESLLALLDAAILKRQAALDALHCNPPRGRDLVPTVSLRIRALSFLLSLLRDARLEAEGLPAAEVRGLLDRYRLSVIVGAEKRDGGPWPRRPRGRGDSRGVK